MSATDKHLEHFSSKKIRGDERVETSLKGFVTGKEKDSKDALMTGRLILTDQRVCFYRKGIIGDKFESIDLPNITSIESSSLLGHRTVKLYSTHNDLTFNSFKPKEEFEQLVTKIEMKMSAERAPKSKVIALSEAEPTVQIKKLADLHEAGILTAEEFTAKKAEILARI